MRIKDFFIITVSIYITFLLSSPISANELLAPNFLLRADISQSIDNAIENVISDGRRILNDIGLNNILRQPREIFIKRAAGKLSIIFNKSGVKIFTVGDLEKILSSVKGYFMPNMKYDSNIMMFVQHLEIEKPNDIGQTKTVVYLGILELLFFLRNGLDNGEWGRPDLLSRYFFKKYNLKLVKDVLKTADIFEEKDTVKKWLGQLRKAHGAIKADALTSVESEDRKPVVETPKKPKKESIRRLLREIQNKMINAIDQMRFSSQDAILPEKMKQKSYAQGHWDKFFETLKSNKKARPVFFDGLLKARTSARYIEIGIIKSEDAFSSPCDEFYAVWDSKRGWLELTPSQQVEIKELLSALENVEIHSNIRGNNVKDDEFWGGNSVMERVDFYYEPIHKQISEWSKILFLRRILPYKTIKILDPACATGSGLVRIYNSLKNLENFTIDVHGNDVNTNMVKRARLNFKKTGLAPANITNFNVFDLHKANKAKKYDLLIAAGLLNVDVLSPASANRLLPLLKKNILPGGYMIVTGITFVQLDSACFEAAGFEVLNKCGRINGGIMPFYVLRNVIKKQDMAKEMAVLLSAFDPGNLCEFTSIDAVREFLDEKAYNIINLMRILKEDRIQLDFTDKLMLEQALKRADLEQSFAGRIKKELGLMNSNFCENKNYTDFLDAAA